MLFFLRDVHTADMHAQKLSFYGNGLSLPFEGLSLLILILAESALETVPKDLWRNPAVMHACT